MNLNLKVDELRDSLIYGTQEVLKIKSVEGEPRAGMPFGEGPAEALDKALEIASDLGFNVVNMDGYIGYAEYGDGEDYVGILGHLDVVPEGEGWIHPPYGAEIHDRKIYARGTLDDKGPIMAALYSLKAIKDLNLTLSKKVRIIFGTNEETGSNEMPYYLKTEKPPVSGFTPDGMFPIINGEKGLTIFDLVKKIEKIQDGDVRILKLQGGNRANMVPDSCICEIKASNKDEILYILDEFIDRTKYKISGKIVDDKIILESKGISAHGSTPEKGINAIMQLVSFIVQLDLPNDDLREYIQFLDKYIGMEVNGESLDIELCDTPSGKLSSNVGIININNEEARTTLNIRYPVTKKLKDMMEPIEEKISLNGIVIDKFTHNEPLYFDSNHPLVLTLQKVYKEQTGNEPELLSIGGGTYAKSIPNILAFGPIFPGKPDLDHQPNENIEVEDLILCCKIYAHAIYELAK